MILRISLVIMVFWIPIELWLSKDLRIIPQWVTWLDEGLLALITIEWIIRMFIVTKKYRRSLLDIPLIGFLLVGVFSALINQIPLVTALFGFRSLLQNVLLYYAIVNSRISRSSIRNLITISVFFALLQIPIGIYQIVMKSPIPLKGGTIMLIGNSVRAFGTFAHPNALGGFLASVLTVFAGWYLFAPKVQFKYRVLLLFTIGMMLLVFVYTFSRTAWIALLAGLLSVLVLKRRGIKALIILFLGAMILGSTFLLFPAFVQRNLVQVERGESYIRYQNLLVSAQILKTSPVLGVGPGTWGSSGAVLLGSSLMEEYDIKSATAESNWLSIIVEFGILGGFAFMLMLLAVFRTNFTAINQADGAYWKGICFGASAFVIGITVLAFTGPAFENQQISFYFWFLAGVCKLIASNNNWGKNET